MTAYYNEIDPFAAAWLRELIKDGLIAPGEVDERSIEDVTPDDLRPFRQCHFFAGIGVWSHSLRLAGWEDHRAIWTGSCPCQPFSIVGKGAGFADERHLWPAFHYLIEQCRPPIVLGEQVASQDGLEWLDLVQSDLEGSGYANGATDTCAAGFGQAHLRQRLWWAAADASIKRAPRQSKAKRAGEVGQGWPFGAMDMLAILESPFLPGGGYPQPILRIVDDGVAGGVVGLHEAGNAINVAQAQGFIEAIMESI